MERPPSHPLAWWRQWRTRLLGAFLLVALVVALAQVVALGRATRAAEATALADHTATAQVLAQATGFFMGRYLATAEAIARTISTDAITPADRHALLVSIQDAFPEIGLVVVSDGRGRVIDASQRSAIGLDVSDRGYFRRLAAGQQRTAIELVLGKHTHTLDVGVAVAMRGPDGTLRGAVGMGVSAAVLNRELGAFLRAGRYPVVIDQWGHLVVHGSQPGSRWTRRDLSGLRPVAEALAGRTVQTSRFTDPLTGEVSLGAFVPVPGLGWVVGVLQPLETAMAAIERERTFALTTVAAVLALALGLALVLSRALSRPLVALASGVRALARGDLQHRVPVESRDEFGELAGRINGMAEDLEAHVEALRASETRFRLAARAASDIIGDWNVRTGEVVWNEALETKGGYRAEEVGRTIEEARAWWSAHLHPEDRHVLDDFQEALESGRETWSAEYRVRWPDGTYSAVLGRTLIARDAAGEPVRVVLALLDISERKRAEQRQRFLSAASALLAASLDYEQTLGAVAHLVVPELADWCVVDLVEPGGRVHTVGVAHRDPEQEVRLRALERREQGPAGPHPVAQVLRTGRSELLGTVPEGWTGTVAADAEHAALLDAAGVRSLIAAPLVARGRTLGALTLVSADDGHRYGPQDLALAEELAERVALAIDNARLYREAERAAEEARAAAREAEEAARAREVFLARASHELRTPLTSAIGTMRLLKRAMAGVLREPPEQLVDIANRNLDAMLALVNALLDASKLATEWERLEAVPVPITRVIGRAVEIVQPQARERGVAIEVAVPPGLTVPGDPDRLEHLLVNLLVNALRHSSPGTRVVVEGTRLEDQVVLRVRDQGEGIPPGALERIFEPFVQVGRPRAGRARGTGLGLSICRQIATLHGGRIWAESAGLGQGSTFVVALPASLRRVEPAA